MTLSYDTRIAGIPVRIGFITYPAEPDVGIGHPYVGDWWIEYIGKRKVKDQRHAEWLRRKLSQMQEFDLCDELMRAVENGEAGYDY